MPTCCVKSNKLRFLGLVTILLGAANIFIGFHDFKSKVLDDGLEIGSGVLFIILGGLTFKYAHEVHQEHINQMGFFQPASTSVQNTGSNPLIRGDQLGSSPGDSTIEFN